MIDISGYNAQLDLATFDAEIVAIKATEGTGYESPAFQHQWAKAKELGKARIAYHLNHPSISGVAQARHFLNVVEQFGLEGDDCLAGDFEETDGMAPEAVAEESVKFRDWIQEQTHCKLICYTYLSFAESGNCNGLGDNPLWIADPSRPPASPRVPLPWKDWAFHQYGIRRGVDADIANFTSLDHLFQFAVLPKPPEPEPNTREVYLTDGKAEHTTFVHESNLVPGFQMTIGDAVFKILR